MELTSSAFQNQQLLPNKYAHNTGNDIPVLIFKDVPKDAKSLALTVIDPDAPNGNFVHWLVCNIAFDTKVIEEGVLPIGAVQGQNDFGNCQWDGPDPPNGTHRYIFTVYAIDVLLDLKTGFTQHELEHAILKHTISSAILIGLYSAQSQ